MSDGVILPKFMRRTHDEPPQTEHPLNVTRLTLATLAENGSGYIKDVIINCDTTLPSSKFNPLV
jgi:hypothetical protein